MAKLDLNDSEFQDEWFALTKEDQNALLKGLSKIEKLTWEQIYADKGLNWEAVKISRRNSNITYYSVRLSQKFRALVTRQGDFVIFVSLHPDHDGAYQ